jgi:RNA polymerase sigma-70 factor (ECF subfamily)
MDEIGLITAARRGDLDAYNHLVLTHQELAFNLAYRILADDAAAEDATQTAFISAYRHLDSYRGGSFRAWVMRMVSNACYDELRRQKRHPTTALEPMDEEGEEELESPAWLRDDSLSPEEQAEQAELNRAVERCLRDLPDEFRAVLVLVDIQGYDYQEVSEVIGKPLGTVKSRLNRGRAELARILRRQKVVV